MDWKTRTSYSRTNIPSRINYPSRNINTSLINELFMVISQGDIFRLKNFILQNNVTFDNAIDNMGNSVLHYIIDSDNYTENQKYELINFMIDRNAPIMTYNNYNITPLHLAAKKQYYHIVKLLINKGSDINAVDNQRMTPLHYSVKGEYVDCPNENVDDIVDIKTNKNPSKMIKDLTQVISTMMYNMEGYNMNLQHIRNTILNFKELYNSKYRQYEDEIQEKLNTILSNNKLSNEQINIQIKSLINNIKLDINKKLTNNLDNSLKIINYKPNNTSFVGPTDLKIFPFAGITDIVNYLRINTDYQFSVYFNNIESRKNIITSKLNNLVRLNNTTDNTIRNLYWYIAGYAINSIKDDSKSKVSDISELNINNLIKNLNNTISKKSDLKLMDIAIDNISQIKNKPYFIDISKKDKNGKFIYDSVIIQNIQKSDEGPQDVKRDFHDNVVKSRIGYNSTPITDDMGSQKIGNNPDIRRSNLIRFDHEQTNLIARNAKYTILGNQFNINYDFNIFSIFRYYISRLEDYYSLIIKNLDKANNNFRDNNYLFIPNMLSNTYQAIINSMSFLILMNNELRDIKLKIKKIISDFEIELSKNRNNPYSFYIDLSLQSIKILENSYEEIKIETMFNDYINVINQMNSFIDTINNRFVFDYLSSITNVFDTSINVNKKIYTNSIISFDTSSINYRSFYDLLNNNNITSQNLQQYSSNLLHNIKTAKKQIIERYIPYLTKYDTSSYIANTDPIIFTDDDYHSIIYYRIGGVKEYDKYYTGVTRVSSVDIPKKTDGIKDDNYGRHGYLFIGIINNNPINFNKLNLINNYKPENNDNEPLIGYYGAIKNSDRPIIKPALNLVKHNLDFYIYNLKFNIVYAFIFIIYEKVYSKPQVPSDAEPITQHLYHLLHNYSKFISQELKLNSKNINEIIFSTVSKIVDSIIVSYIKESINLTSIKSTRELFNVKLNKYSKKDFLHNITNNDIILDIISTEDYGFRLSLNDIIDEVINKYTKQSISYGDINKSYQLNYTISLLEPVKNNNNILTIHKYSLDNQRAIKQCYLINDKVTKLLLYKSNINSRDIVGNTPLFYAIDSQNVNMVKMLLNNGANVNIKNVRNNIGLTPLTFAINSYKSHIPLINNTTPDFIYSFTKSMYDETIETINQNSNSKNNILKFSDIIFPYILVLINNFIFFEMKKYPVRWTFKKMKLLSKYITNDELLLLNPPLPILQITEQEIRETGISGTNVLMDVYKNNYSNMISIENRIEELIHSNENLKEELYQYDNEYGNNAIIEKINTKIKANNNEITELRKYLEDIDNTEINTVHSKEFIEMDNISRIIGNLNNNLSSDNIVETYDNIFWDIFNNKKNREWKSDLELYLYPALINKYINSNKINDVTVIHPFLQNYINFILNENSYNNDFVYKKLSLISQVYNNIFYPIAKNYEDLPKNLENNQVLNISYNIIVHVIKHTLMVSLYYGIIKTIAKFIDSTHDIIFDNDIDKSILINSIIDEIVNETDLDDKINISPLMEYIFDTLPYKLVKITIGVYENEYDDDIGISVDKLYQNIIELIVDNPISPISNDSTLVQALEQYIIPYYRDYINIFITNAKNMIDNYFGYVQSEAKLMTILIELLEKAKIE